MSVRDLLAGENNDMTEKLKSSNLPSEPDIGLFEQIGVALDKPSVTGGAFYRYMADKVDGSKKYNPKELQMMYPDAPEGTFQVDNTKRMADWLYKRALNDDLFSNINKYRSLGHGKVYNAITDFGYGVVQETSPTDIALGVASGGLVSAASSMAAASLAKGTSASLAVRGLSYLGQSTTKAILASELAEGLVSLPFDYALRKGLEPYTQEKESFADAVLGTIGGVAISGGGRVLAKSIFGKYKSKISQRMSPEARQAFGNGLEEELNSMTEAGMDWEMAGKYSELSKLENLSLDDRLRYKVYSASKLSQQPTVPGETPRQGMYALFTPSSEMSHHSAASPFGMSTHVATNEGDVRAFSAAVKQRGQLVELDPNEFNILDLNKLDDASEEAVAIKEILKAGGIEKESLQDGLKELRMMDEGADIIEMDIQEYLKSAEYDGVTLKEIHNLADDVFEKVNTYIFDGIQNKSRRILTELDGSLGGLPESTVMFNPSKKAAIAYGDGVLSNGKKISLDPNGYFNTDPFYGNPVKGLSYTELYSIDQMNEINTRIDEGNLAGLKRKYKSLTDSTIEYIKNVQIMKEFEEASMKQEKIAKLPEEWEPVMKDILDTETEIELVKKMIIEQGNYEANKELIQKTVEQQAKEGKASRILEEKDFDKLTKKMTDMVDKRIGTGKIAQTDAIIEGWKAKLEELKINNPDVADEIVKAADFCLRKYTT